MTDQLISFETAKLAKEKGFNIPCTDYFLEGHYVSNQKYVPLGLYVTVNQLRINRNKYTNNIYSAPTQSLLQKWLREEHSIDIIIEPNANEIQKYYCWRIRKNMEPAKWGNVTNTFEEALEAGLQQTLKLIK